MYQTIRMWAILLATLVACPFLVNDALANPAEHRVMAFYYPWYGTADGPGGAGRTIHWGKIDAENQDIAASTHYPALGAYDSHDVAVINTHCEQAKAAHIDTLIVSWWGHGDYTDRVMTKILDACATHGLKACIYYERVPEPQTAETAARDIIKVLEKYGDHPAYLKAEGHPVVFVYGRAVNELGLTAWYEAVQAIKVGYKGGVTAIGDQFSYGAARVFDGVHTYNTAGSITKLSLDELRTWACDTYTSWVQLADRAHKISTITIIPGYDDTKIRTPGLAVQRFDGKLYEVEWDCVMKADPDWVLITSFNEWHEGSEIEPSAESGRKYLDLTTEYAGRFKAMSRADHVVTSGQSLSEQQKHQIRETLKSFKIAALPMADSTAFWWLLDLGVDVKLLTWEDIAAGTLVTKQYDLLLNCSGEHYRRTVNQPDDVEKAIGDYLHDGGFLVFLPSNPWPFYYDENGHPVNRSARFGLTLRMGWETPPEGKDLFFVQPDDALPEVPKRFAFPSTGDLRWRGFFAQNDSQHIPLLQLRSADGDDYGDAIAYACPKTGGQILYVWFTLLDGPDAESLLYDVFSFATRQLNP